MAAARVLLAMSGGVDSSVAACLLREEGYQVTGAAMNLLGTEETVPGQKSCCSLSDLADAREVAGLLGFDFYVFNFRRIFNHEVIRRFAEAYCSGLTPNPCLDCNRYMKFRYFWDRAKVLNNDFMATGHYARREYAPDTGRYVLKKALDTSKDQSYVLYTLSQAELARTLFPLGNLAKTEVRALALKLGLANAQKPDSQDICFVRQGRYSDFLSRIVKLPKAGNIIDTEGRVLGRHNGIHNFTVGQKKKLGLKLPEPRYVISLEPETDTVVVGAEEDLDKGLALITDVNYISIPELTGPLAVTAKIRYRQEEIPAEISPHPLGAVLTFAWPQRAVTPGQAAVFYSDDLVIGGGTIARQKP
ncbi:MAG: tRNA 2-thiouridine(34) synthase MnmA [Deltaproteobacteria bacterium]|jgi:tRNA-specific 2-thiouridylase|nr:tRNA 2-thiouridine(34) synthase MnmA [Deltaproteobacteria bacterium]